MMRNTKAKRKVLVTDGEGEVREEKRRGWGRRLRCPQKLEPLHKSSEILDRLDWSLAPPPPVGLGDDDRSGHRDPHHEPYLHIQWIKLSQWHIDLIRERGAV